MGWAFWTTSAEPLRRPDVTSESFVEAGEGALRAEVARFGERLVDVLRQSLGDGLLGAYFVGSTALGGYVPGESDLDVSAVGRGSVRDDVREELIDRLLRLTESCPARGLEFTLYPAASVASAAADTDFVVNLNGGPRMPEAVHRDAADEPGFFYVIDRAIAHRYGMAIFGPPPATLFVDIPRSVLLQQLRASMLWHREHEKATLYSVLNACRAWRFAQENVLGSKLAGSEWARTRWSNPSLIDAAVDLRFGRPAELDNEEVDRLLAFVTDHVSAAR